MKLFIDGSEVKYELGGENTLSEVFSEIQRFLYTHKRAIDEVIVDGVKTPLSEVIDSSTPLSAINTIEVRTLPILEWALGAITPVTSQISSLLKADTSLERENIVSSFKVVLEAVQAILDGLEIPPTNFYLKGYKLQDIISQLNVNYISLVRNINNFIKFSDIWHSTKDLLQLLGQFLTKIYKRYLTIIEHPTKGYYYNLLNEIEELYSEIPNIKSLVDNSLETLRLGEAKAMTDLIRLTSYLEHMLYLMNYLKEYEVDVATFDLSIPRFEELMKKLLDALENQDFTLLSDIIEFDVLHWLDTLQSQIPKILSKIKEVYDIKN